MAVLLIALSGSIAGCATSLKTVDYPEVRQTLQDSEPAGSAPALPALPLPDFYFTGTVEVAGQEVAYLDEGNFNALTTFVFNARANTEALEQRTEAVQYWRSHSDSILEAGQEAEREAAYYRQQLMDLETAGTRERYWWGAATLILLIGAAL